MRPATSAMFMDALGFTNGFAWVWPERRMAAIASFVMPKTFILDERGSGMERGELGTERRRNDRQDQEWMVEGREGWSAVMLPFQWP